MPGSLTVDSNSNIYFLDQQTNTIAKVDSNGKFLMIYNFTSLTISGFSLNTDDSNLYIGDVANQVIAIISTSTGQLLPPITGPYVRFFAPSSYGY